MQLKQNEVELKFVGYLASLAIVCFFYFVLLYFLFNHFSFKIGSVQSSMVFMLEYI